jgi:hypothetical protein
MVLHHGRRTLGVLHPPRRQNEDRCEFRRISLKIALPFFPSSFRRSTATLPPPPLHSFSSFIACRTFRNFSPETVVKTVCLSCACVSTQNHLLFVPILYMARKHVTLIWKHNRRIILVTRRCTSVARRLQDTHTHNTNFYFNLLGF